MLCPTAYKIAGTDQSIISLKVNDLRMEGSLITLIRNITNDTNNFNIYKNYKVKKTVLHTT